MEALSHGGFHHGAPFGSTGSRPRTSRGEATEAASPAIDGIVIPGGFGVRGVEGKIAAAGFAREHGVPFLGLCLGLQCAVIEFARHVCGLEGANSSEFDPACAAPRDRPHSRAEGRHGHGRHHAPGRPAVLPGAGDPSRQRRTAAESSRSATAIATRSTPPTRAARAAGW